MKVEEIRMVGILGAGTMGAGIAQVFAQYGFDVRLMDTKDEFVQRGINRIRTTLQRLVNSGKIKQEEADSLLARIRGTTDLEEVAKNADFIVEAVQETLELKKQVFRDVDRICVGHTILATNTSSLSVTEIASVTGNPNRVIGMHFFNPAPVMKLVEIIPGLRTSTETIMIAKELVKKLGKTPVEVREASGFIVNRIMAALMNEAMYCLMRGIAEKPEDIDTSCKLGLNHPMGPFELMDLVGLDIILSILDAIYEEEGDPKWRACPLLRKLVRAGFLGRKTGKGWYEYE